MPKFLPNVTISDCWSSVGDITFFHIRGTCYFKKKNDCLFRGTAGQMIQASIHRRALAAWQHLEHNVQEVWNLVATDACPHRPPFCSSSHISGFNLFVSAYHGFAQLGQERIPEPRIWEEFPSFYFDQFAITNNSETTGFVFIDCRLNIAAGTELSRYRLLGKIQLVPPGKGSNPGLMRTYIAEDIRKTGQSSKLCRFSIPVSMPAQEFQLHAKLLLLDSSSGYRSQWQKCSQVL